MQIERCDRCQKPLDLCFCAEIQPLTTQTQVLILQHPQEPNEELGSARLAHLALSNSTLKIGLSWPNLSKALGKETQASEWAVLYLGSGIKTEVAQKESINPAQTKPGQAKKDAKKLAVKYHNSTVRPEHLGEKVSSPLQFVTSKGIATPRPKSLKGIVILDGTWSQAKALWWRNAWLLKLKRVILIPQRPSLYKNLRKEPRPECLSTVESIAETLLALGEPTEVSTSLEGIFKTLLDKQKARRKKT